MLRFVGKRVWEGALTLAALVTLAFFVMRLAPGGPFSKNRKISPEVLANIQERFHLDEPVWQQFGRYVWGSWALRCRSLSSVPWRRCSSRCT